MTEFEALVDSLGRSTRAYLGEENLVSLFGQVDKLTGTAHIEIALRDSGWEAQEAAIDKMIEIRLMFIDDLSLDYIFVDGEGAAEQGRKETSSEFIYA